MKIQVEAEFTADDVAEICKREFIRTLGSPPDGHRLEVSGCYCRITVRTVKEPELEPEAVLPRNTEPAKAEPVMVEHLDGHGQAEPLAGISDTNSMG